MIKYFCHCTALPPRGYRNDDWGISTHCDWPRLDYVTEVESYRNRACKWLCGINKSIHLHREKFQLGYESLNA
tara:strand:- start:298 stop:516 length:219 start_codon:yes stop_codon:yes gene_type:complete